MMILRWLYFALGMGGWIIICVQIWHRAGWMLGAIAAISAFNVLLDWLESTMLKQYKMKRIVTYEEIE